VGRERFVAEDRDLAGLRRRCFWRLQGMELREADPTEGSSNPHEENAVGV